MESALSSTAAATADTPRRRQQAAPVHDLSLRDHDDERELRAAQQHRARHSDHAVRSDRSAALGDDDRLGPGRGVPQLRRHGRARQPAHRCPWHAHGAVRVRPVVRARHGPDRRGRQDLVGRRRLQHGVARHVALRHRLGLLGSGHQSADDHALSRRQDAQTQRAARLVACRDHHRRPRRSGDWRAPPGLARQVRGRAAAGHDVARPARHHGHGSRRPSAPRPACRRARCSKRA